jgi:endonuclease-3 related protein
MVPNPLQGNDSEGKAARLLDVHQRLLAAYGPQGWWPGGAGPFEVCVGAILTQSAAWTNVEMALARMRAAEVLSLDGLHRTPVEALAQIIRPSGYFNAKARKLKAFATHVHDGHGGDLAAMLTRPMEGLRPELLAVHGIGEETADDIVLYAAHQPSFVVDAFTRRILTRLGLAPPVDRYESYRALFMDALPEDTALYQEYHALLVRLAKEACAKRAPRCGGCPLRDICPTGREWAA